MSIQDIPLESDFRERAKANDVPVAHLIGFEAKDIADGRATVALAAGPQHANPMGPCTAGFSVISRTPQWEWRLKAPWHRMNPSQQSN